MEARGKKLRVRAGAAARARRSSDRSTDVASFVHNEDIRQSGLTAAKLAELSEGRGPQEMTDDESVVFAFSNELARSGRVRTSFRNGCRESLRASMRVGPSYCMSGSPTLRCRCPNA